MNNKRKNRPGPTRPQRGRTVSVHGIYNNSFFMHAATSFVGNLVQVQTHSGSIYEGVFKTFSPKFEVAIELAQCIKSSSQNQKGDDQNSLTECMVFQPNHIVSIVSKEVDPDFAIGGAFQTDSDISRCNGLTRIEEKELEPWDPSSGGSVNGDIELQLDGNANGWDANEMFNKNEKLYGVQSTFDSSLAGYTVPIEKQDTQEFKIAEAEAEKIAQEIENNPNSKERIDIENGDEETQFAAVERPSEQSPAISPTSTNSPSTMSKGTNNLDKYALPPKRKNIQAGKVVRSTPPPNNNNGPLPQHNSHSNSKNNNYQSMQMQNTPPYPINQSYSHIHGHSSTMSQSKINGEGSNNNSNNKPLPQRSIRQYPQQSNAYSEPPPPMSGQMSMGKPPVHVAHNHTHMSSQHISNNMQETPPPPQPAPIIYQQVVQLAPNQSGPPPQPQRQPRAREEMMQDFRKFQQDFHLAGSNQQQQQGQQVNQVKTPSVSPHQQPQPSLSPPQPHQQQQLSPMSQHPPQPQPTQQHHQHHQQHQQQQPQPQQQQPPPPQPPQQQQAPQQHSQQQQTENSPPLQTQKSTQSHMQQTEQQQSYQPPPTSQQQQQQQQSPPTIISPNTSCSSISSAPTSTTPPQQSQQLVNTNNSNSGNESSSSEKTPTTTVVKKTHQLNPAAKPFTPRSPSTPNPSRPHTPQTPGPTMTPGVYTPGPHVAAGPVTYVMPPQPSFQTAPHPHAGQQGRLRRAPMAASQMQVSAATATGQPLLTAATPIQQFIHYPQSPHPSHFQSQPYQHMVRMYHEPPPQQIQFLAQTPPSTTPSPGQPHQQFHPGPQPSPAGGGPPAFGPTAQPGPHFQMMCPVLAGHPQLVPNYYQGAAQTPHHAQQFQVIMQQQHPAP